MKNKLEIELLNGCIKDLEDIYDKLYNTDILNIYSKNIDRYKSTIRTVIIRLRAVRDLIDY